MVDEKHLGGSRIPGGVGIEAPGIQERWRGLEENVARVPDLDGGAEETGGAGGRELGCEGCGGGVVREDLRLLLQNLLIGALGCPPVLLVFFFVFFLVFLPSGLGGLTGAHRRSEEGELWVDLVVGGGRGEGDRGGGVSLRGRRYRIPRRSTAVTGDAFFF